ncbi:hypothetical protein Pla110_38510 [Polystyrenella longa]|uniref:ATP-grasp domain-containing protein n=1 Tax=Polystyrenella longa TaxID=2528007 RepID=A0A518CSB0_9PLAN|nr:hypothetical protein [Polystyrenella longa]QDU82096.1 hypothetical protein Pla110_38510 [Polystyrenella longa]
MPSQLFFSNFDFEYQLNERYRPTPRIQRLSDELAFCWLALADGQDQVLLQHPVDTEFTKYLQQAGLHCPRFISDDIEIEVEQLTPWGWSKEAREFATTFGLLDDLPALDIIRKVNSRQWAVEFESETEQEERVSWLLTSQSDLEAALREIDPDEEWLIKTNLSMSGRDRIAGRGIQLTTANAGWIRKRLSSETPLVLERRLKIEQEIGVQFEITTSGDPELVDLLPMLVDRTGRYAGSWLLDQGSLLTEWQREVDSLAEIAITIQQDGYFGPVGFDVMRYRNQHGELQTRLFQDINGRYTMGRVAAGWRRYLQPGEVGCWLHFAQRCETKAELEQWWGIRLQLIEPTVRLIRTSPLCHAGEIVGHQTGLLIATDETTLRRQVQAILDIQSN